MAHSGHHIVPCFKIKSSEARINKNLIANKIRKTIGFNAEGIHTVKYLVQEPFTSAPLVEGERLWLKLVFTV